MMSFVNDGKLRVSERRRKISFCVCRAETGSTSLEFCSLATEGTQEGQPMGGALHIERRY